jgi:predicted metal-dependent phosphoesterase TrpH
MGLEDGVADLHVHTTASDGTCSVADRIEQARDRELGAISITDHDTIATEIGARRSVRAGVELVAGIEVRADARDTKVELLGYYVDPTDEGLAGVLETIRGYRRERNRQLIDRLQEGTPLERSYEEIRAGAPGILGRPHVASVLVEEGIVDSVGEAFAEYLGENGAAFVPMERMPAPEVVEAIQGAGGVVSLAHPGRIRSDDLVGILADLVDAGLDALEVRYPYGGVSAGTERGFSVRDAATLAEAYDLLRTGGSDCHGPGSGKFRIGEVRITAADLTALCDRAAERQPF